MIKFKCATCGSHIDNKRAPDILVEKMKEAVIIYDDSIDDEKQLDLFDAFMRSVVDSIKK